MLFLLYIYIFTMITRTTIIGDIVRKYPETIEIFFDYGVHCASCHVNEFETLEQGILSHGFSEGELIDLIEDLNDAVLNYSEEKSF